MADTTPNEIAYVCTHATLNTLQTPNSLKLMGKCCAAVPEFKCFSVTGALNKTSSHQTFKEESKQ